MTIPSVNIVLAMMSPKWRPPITSTPGGVADAKCVAKAPGSISWEGRGVGGQEKP